MEKVMECARQLGMAIVESEVYTVSLYYSVQIDRFILKRLYT